MTTPFDSHIKFDYVAIRKITHEFIKKIKPDKEEKMRIAKVCNEVITRLYRAKEKESDSVPQLKNVEIQLMGSIAKGTYIKGVADIDIFVLFPKAFSLAEIEKYTKRIVSLAFPKEEKLLAYAEHPYIRVKEFNGFKLDIVPAYKISNAHERISSVDRTQLHTNFVNERLTTQQKDEVRLLKQFAKANNIYGAELKIEGFSGYVCELLIIKFGSFISVLKAFAAWEMKPIIIDTHKNYIEDKKNLQMYKSSNKKQNTKINNYDSTVNIDQNYFGNPPLLIIDPVDNKRNAAASVSATNLAKMIYAARKFLRNPSIELLGIQTKELTDKDKKQMLIKALARKTYIFGIVFKKPEIIDDMLYPQLKRASTKIFEQLQLNEFNIFGYIFDVENNECVIVIELYHKTLPNIKKFIGPSIVFAKNSDEFLRAHRNANNIHIEHFNLVAIEKRRYVDAIKLIEHYLKHEQKGISLQIKQSIKEYTILEIQELIDRFPVTMDKYLNGLEKEINPQSNKN